MNEAFWRLWGWPLLIGCVTAFGLASALVGDGIYDLLSWIGLGLPVTVGVRHMLRNEKSCEKSREKKGGRTTD